MHTQDKVLLATGVWIGEGSFRRGRGDLFAFNTEREVLEILVDAFGGKIYGPYTRGGLSKRPSYTWTLTLKNGSREVAALMWPHLTQRRREQIAELIGVVK